MDHLNLAAVIIAVVAVGVGIGDILKEFRSVRNRRLGRAIKLGTTPMAALAAVSLALIPTDHPTSPPLWFWPPLAFA